MTHRKLLLLAAGLIVSAAFAPLAARAQQSDNRPLADFTPYVPPIIPLPPSSQLTPGGVGRPQQSPYTTAPLQDPQQGVFDRQPAPGLKLTIPTR